MLTVLAPKRAGRLAAEERGRVDLVAGGRARARRSTGRPGGDGMTRMDGLAQARRNRMKHPTTARSIDLERELVRYMAERRVTRRELLERIGASRRHGGPGAGHRRLHGQRREHQPVGAAARGYGARGVAGPTPRPRRHRCRRPRASSSSTTTPSTWPGDHQAVRGPARGQGHRDLLRLLRRAVPARPAGRHGFRPDLPDRRDIPGFVEAGAIAAARPVAHPERRQPRRPNG